MLNVNPELICKIIFKARDFFGKEAVDKSDDPEELKDFSDDFDFQILADYEDDLTFLELKSAIEDLEPDQQATLVALFWVGRGDFDVNEWDEAYKEAIQNWNSRTADYLLTKPLLADYLQEALADFDYRCEV
jgi:hypothetical protein